MRIRWNWNPSVTNSRQHKSRVIPTLVLKLFQNYVLLKYPGPRVLCYVIYFDFALISPAFSIIVTGYDKTIEIYSFFSMFLFDTSRQKKYRIHRRNFNIFQTYIAHVSAYIFSLNRADLSFSNQRYSQQVTQHIPKYKQTVTYARTSVNL